MDLNKKISDFVEEMVKRGKITAEEAKTLAKEYSEKGKDKLEDIYEHTSDKISALAKEYGAKGKELTEDVGEKLTEKLSDVKEKA
jgi:polyhydroxyalkanoate synthesis regulator phasin